MIKLAILIALSSGALFAAAFQNGGFEGPVLAVSPDFSTAPTGWTKGDPTAINLFLESYSTFGLPALEGNQALGFGAFGATTGSISQTFDTLAGHTYRVS